MSTELAQPNFVPDCANGTGPALARRIEQPSGVNEVDVLALVSDG
jgi:hypothetical protein